MVISILSRDVRESCLLYGNVCIYFEVVSKYFFAQVPTEFRYF